MSPQEFRKRVLHHTSKKKKLHTSTHRAREERERGENFIDRMEELSSYKVESME